MHSDAQKICGGEARQRQIVEIDKALQEIPGRVDLKRQPSFGEVDLHLVRALAQAGAHLGLVLAE